MAPVPLPLPRVGLGTAPLGGMFAPVSDEAATATVHAAISHGWSLVDTAPLYGHGLSETRVGRALPADGVIVSTKVGRLVRPIAERADDDIFVGAPPGEAEFDFTADGVRRSLAASLERLGRDTVDIALLHDPEQHLDLALGEAVRALLELRDAGTVRAIGVGTNFVETALRFVEETPVDVVLIAGRTSLLDRSAEPELLPRCAARGVQVVAGGVFNSGALADPSDGHYAYAGIPDDVGRRRDRLAALCESAGVPLAAAAIQHPFRSPAVTSIVVGCRIAEEVDANVALLATPVPDDRGAALEEVSS
jgi:D-threo-aldose 1-dehydrogenase